MATKSGKGSKDVGGGPGTATAGQVKSTMQPTFGKRVSGKRTGKRGGSR